MFYTHVINPILSSIRKYGNRNAFCIDGLFYTYNMLGQQISNIRNAISKSEFESSCIGLVINDDIETYASIIAIWLDGYSYVPLHPKWPHERCMDISRQVNIDLILDSSNESKYIKENINVLLTRDFPRVEKCNLSPKDNVSDEDLAYILFTSGSTGKPKGVQLSRKNLGAFMDSFWKTGIVIDKNDRCLQAFDLTFDVSIQSYLVPLCKGACCYTIPYGQIKYVYASGLIEDQKITFGAMAPSMLRYLKPYFGEFDASSMRQCILTAEACPIDLMEDWFIAAPNVDIYDFYGPTEGTIYCTFYKLSREDSNKTLNGIVSIGKPMANVTALILDESGNELPLNEKGELCIAGPQLTKGYYNNPSKNIESFFYKKVDGKTMRFYHTGDLCYKDETGDIMYSGRMDYQVKIQGFRVEMGEIEYHAREFLKGINVVCLAYNNSSSLSEIAMFIEHEEFNTDSLIDYMRTRMPAYMIPSKIVFQKEFVLNNNGKIDKNILKSLINK